MPAEFRFAAESDVILPLRINRARHQPWQTRAATKLQPACGDASSAPSYDRSRRADAHPPWLADGG